MISFLSGPKRVWGAWLGLLMVSLALALWVGGQVRTFAHYPPDFDEAVHLLPVVQVATALQRGDLRGFWQATTQQDQLAAYPFVHSWLAATVWLLRPGITPQRWFSLACVVGSILLAFGLGQHLAPRRPWLAGLLSGGLLAASFPLWLYGSLAYLEGVGLLLTLLTCYLYIQALAGEKRLLLLATSLAAAAAFLTKYNFGLFLMGAIALNEGLAWLLARPAALPWRRWLWLGTPAALILLLWLAAPGRLARFLHFSQAQEGQMAVWQGASWLYYPHSFYAHYLSGPAALLPVLGGLLLAASWWRDGRFRFLLIYLGLSWLLLVLVPQKVPRFLYTVAPVALLLAGPFVVWLSDRMLVQGKRVRLVALLFTLLWAGWWGTAVSHQFSYLQAGLDVAFDSVPSTASGYDWINERTLAQNGTVYLLNGWHLFNPYSLQWHYLAGQGFPAAPLAWRQAQSGPAPEPTPANLAQLVAQWRAQNIDYVVSIDGSPAGSYTGWAVVEPLLNQGRLQPLGSSGSLTLRDWDNTYRERVLAAAFADRAEWAAWQQERRGDYQIRLHLYRIVWEND
jgi:4-amino-4-deoxy-L-arabinose transferase-like glycosyltransferase